MYTSRGATGNRMEYTHSNWQTQYVFQTTALSQLAVARLVTTLSQTAKDQDEKIETPQPTPKRLKRET